MQWEAEQEEGNDVTGPVDKAQLSSELLSITQRPKSIPVHNWRSSVDEGTLVVSSTRVHVS